MKETKKSPSWYKNGSHNSKQNLIQFIEKGLTWYTCRQFELNEYRLNRFKSNLKVEKFLPGKAILVTSPNPHSLHRQAQLQHH